MYQEALPVRLPTTLPDTDQPRLCVRLLGKFSVCWDNRPIDGLQAGKVPELLGYLLLHRDCSQPRELLADRLWPGGPTARSRKYLRDALWRLQTALRVAAGEGWIDPILEVEPDWIRLNAGANLWIDVDVLEGAARQVRGACRATVEGGIPESLRSALDLYRGDLLEGWYQDWCVAERERLRDLYLSLLQSALKDAEARQDFGVILEYGTRILRIDRAHEATHRRLMRARYLMGDRTGALRQYERCRAALAEDLDIAPSRRTEEVLAQIRGDRIGRPAVERLSSDRGSDAADPFRDALAHLRQAEQLLEDLRRRIGDGSRQTVPPIGPRPLPRLE